MLYERFYAQGRHSEAHALDYALSSRMFLGLLVMFLLLCAHLFTGRVAEAQGRLDGAPGTVQEKGAPTAPVASEPVQDQAAEPATQQSAPHEQRAEPAHGQTPPVQEQVAHPVGEQPTAPTLGADQQSVEPVTEPVSEHRGQTAGVAINTTKSTVEPLQQQAEPAAGSLAGTVEQTSNPRVEPIQSTHDQTFGTAPQRSRTLTGRAQQAAGPVTEPPERASQSVADPVVGTDKPVVGTVNKTTQPVNGAAAPVVQPVKKTGGPVVKPELETAEPETAEPVVKPVVDPAIEVVDPVVEPVVNPAVGSFEETNEQTPNVGAAPLHQPLHQAEPLAAAPHKLDETLAQSAGTAGAPVEPLKSAPARQKSTIALVPVEGALRVGDGSSPSRPAGASVASSAALESGPSVGVSSYGPAPAHGGVLVSYPEPHPSVSSPAPMGGHRVMAPATTGGQPVVPVFSGGERYSSSPNFVAPPPAAASDASSYPPRPLPFSQNSPGPAPGGSTQGSSGAGPDLAGVLPLFLSEVPSGESLWFDREFFRPDSAYGLIDKQPD